MPVNINRATATQYQLVIPMLPTETTLDAVDVVRLNLFSVVLPAISLNQGESTWQGMKMLFHNGGMSFDPLSVSFMVDSDFSNWHILYKWLIYVCNNFDKPSSLPADYMVDMSIKLMDNYNVEKVVIMFKNVWIQSLGELSLSVRDGESHIECNATLYYDRYEIL